MRTKQQTRFFNQSAGQTNKINKTVLSILFTLLTFLFSSAFCYAASSIPAANLKGVTITDSASKNVPPTAVINYTKQGDTYNFDASGSSDSDGTIADYRWDFGDGGTGAGVTVSHVYSGLGNFPVTLTVIDDKAGVGLSQNAISNSFNIAVNFQPETAPVPNGFVMDSGLPYDATRGYGWVQLPSKISSYGARDRNNSISPDQSYDTLIWFYSQASPVPIWEMDVPNGHYLVTICMGDPTYGNDRQDAQVEGIPIINNQSLTSSLRWIEKSGAVEIVDGKLTLTFTGSSQYARLNWIKIVSQ